VKIKTWEIPFKSAYYRKKINQKSALKPHAALKESRVDAIIRSNGTSGINLTEK